MAELLSEPDVEVLSRFFANAESHNRSLDLAQEALGTHASNFQREVDRAVLKAESSAPRSAFPVGEAPTVNPQVPGSSPGRGGVNACEVPVYGGNLRTTTKTRPVDLKATARVA